MIPLLRITQPEKDAVWAYFKRSIDANRLANCGPCYMEAKRRIEDETGRYAWVVANATLGLELAARVKFKPGSKVLIPSFTFKATYLAVLAAGCEPITAEVDPVTWCLRPSDIVDSGANGAIIVSPFGRPVPFHLYETLGVPIIFDMAGAWGQWYKGDHLAVYSMHATKRMPVGEGGMILGPELDTRRCWDLANFSHTNAKLSELSCAMLLALMDMNLDTGPSLNVMAFNPHDVYKVITSPVFQAKRYYYPLIEDLYDCIVYRATSHDHITRHTVALPRDTTLCEERLIADELSSLGAYPLCV